MDRCLDGDERAFVHLHAAATPCMRGLLHKVVRDTSGLDRRIAWLSRTTKPSRARCALNNGSHAAATDVAAAGAMEAEVDRIQPAGRRGGPAYGLVNRRCAAARSPCLGPILSRFCLESVSTREKSPNSASYSPLRGHTHAITNVNDDATVPQTAKWNPNYLDPKLNNYRQNQQGEIPPTALPDVTSDTISCTLMGDNAELSAEVCNRGTKTVGAGLKTAFYEGAPKDGKLLCVAATADALDIEKCAVVTCQYNGTINGAVHVVGNDDGMGGKTTLECIYTNNDDVADPIECK